MRHVELVEGKAVADIGPGHVAHQREVEPLARRESPLPRRDQHRDVEQRDEAGPHQPALAAADGRSGRLMPRNAVLGLVPPACQHRHFSRRADAVMRLAATSASLRRSRIAVCLSSV